jgi:hypothetical protein
LGKVKEVRERERERERKGKNGYICVLVFVMYKKGGRRGQEGTNGRRSP